MVLAVGELFFYAAISEETANQLEIVVKAFKEANPASNRVQIIVIDKDFTQHRVLITGFPQANFFCQFHVINYLYKKVSHCDILKDDKEELRGKLKSLVYAASETEYDELKNEIASIANSEFH